MRINVYSQELTPEVLHVEKISNTTIPYEAAQLILHSSDRLHHPPEDDDRSAVTFWLPKSKHRREEMAQAFERIAAIFRGSQQPSAQEVVGEMDRTAPPRVWLQIDPTGDETDRSEVIPESAWEDLTWHYSPIGGQEVEYIRKDLTPNMRPVSDEDVERLAEAIFGPAWSFRSDVRPQNIRAALESFLARRTGEGG